ncbi:Protocatechuate 3,4-dioxygenase alpha subunit [Hyphomicrobiales bacterium]|nr:Protocatechuate 3,4-dioxygenase subunit alpha [Hyphomicrobiales bacterium]CAH1696511.1 Protocatechuate 3,4-dioxygenase alpha subunit [Hyphomicrobiales bacterium]
MNKVLTPSQTSGPLFGFALMREGLEWSVDPAADDAVEVEGQLFDGQGRPIAFEAFVEFWSAAQSVRARALEDGRYKVVLEKPVQTKLSDGRVLAPHFNVAVFGRGLARQLVTRMYFPDEPELNATDPILDRVPAMRRDTLVARPANSRILRFDIHFQGEAETVFFKLDAPRLGQEASG